MSKTPRAVEQEQVLADVRRALGRSETIRPAPLEPFVEARTEETGAELDARFTGEATAVGAQVHRASSAEEAVALVARICQAARVREVALSGAPLLTEMDVRAQLAARGLPAFRVTETDAAERDKLITRLECCGAGVTAVDYALAETGTVALSSDEEGALLVSLLPAIHIALLRPQQIIGSIADVIGKLKLERMGRAGPSRAATFITGPSRTSDVELVLSIGVHGPKELHLIMLGA
ncbi:MAG: lactate utilization protein C [Pyrinomonadaceae bacterium]